MNHKKTIQQVQQLVQSAEPRQLYLSASYLNNSPHQTWSIILVDANSQILARFNNQQVIRPIEAKAYAILRTAYWLLENHIPSATLFTDNYDIWRRFLKLSQRPLSAGYQLEREFYYSKRSKIAWPYYCWLARKLMAEQDLDLTVDYLPPEQNPACLISQSLKVCAKCQQLKRISSRKRNCYSCWQASQQTKYQRWQEWQKSQLTNHD